MTLLWMYLCDNRNFPDRNPLRKFGIRIATMRPKP